MAKKNKSQKSSYKSNLLYKISLVVISTFIIVWFMPRNDAFQFAYEVSRPWQYGELIAKKTFPVYKSAEELQAEKEKALKDFRPYYKLDKSVRNVMRAKIADDEIIKKSHAPNAEMYIAHIKALLDTVYSRGVLTVVDYNHLIEEGYNSIRILDKNTSVTVPASKVFSTKTAYQYIMAADSTRYSHIIMQSFNINQLLSANLTLDTLKTKSDLSGYLSNIDGADSIVQSGQRIIDRGEIVTAEKYKILQSYERSVSKEKNDTEIIPYSIIGKVVFVMFIMIILITYLSLFRKDYFDKYQTGILLFSFPVAFCVIAFLMVSHNLFNVFVIPCCMVPIVIRVFMDSRTAFMFHTAMVVIISLALQRQYEFVVLQLLTGMIAIQTLRELSQRSQIIHTAALITASYIVFYASYELISENAFNKADQSIYIFLVVNGILLLFTYPLLWLIEKSLSFVSDVTLIELSSTSHPLLQRMSEIAPGTLQHSMQVANLASEVAKKTDARVQLVRTGALYHDIGKLERPVFFTENQKGISPHKHLSTQKSAEVIIAHVQNGLALAEKHNLPKIIKDFIRTHHGEGLTKYFYVTYKNEHPDEVVDESMFRYPGPNPTTKEQAILMMADAVEASSRSLTEYTEESISQLVDKIIDSQIQDGFFSECDITFRDIAIAKSVFKEKLQTIYHTRISYPELNKDNEK